MMTKHVRNGVHIVEYEDQNPKPVRIIVGYADAAEKEMVRSALRVWQAFAELIDPPHSVEIRIGLPYVAGDTVYRMPPMTTEAASDLLAQLEGDES